MGPDAVWRGLRQNPKSCRIDRLFLRKGYGTKKGHFRRISVPPDPRICSAASSGVAWSIVRRCETLDASQLHRNILRPVGKTHRGEGGSIGLKLDANRSQGRRQRCQNLVAKSPTMGLHYVPRLNFRHNRICQGLDTK